MADDSLVVDLLLRLHRSPPPPPCLNLHWTVRQRRSRSAHNKAESTRASPTTPLSWSGATSASGGNLDGYEEYSRPSKPTQTSRSKVRLSLSLFASALTRLACLTHSFLVSSRLSKTPNNKLCFCVLCGSITRWCGVVWRVTFFSSNGRKCHTRTRALPPFPPTLAARRSPLAGAPVSVVSVFSLLEDYPIPVAFNLKLILYLILIHSS